MDVVLLKPVESLGAEGQVVSVKPGYARNYLIPSGLAVAATAEQLSRLQAMRQQRDHKARRVLEQAQALKQKLESRSISLKLALGEGDKSFGAITTHDIAEALANEGTAIEKQHIRLEQPIKSLGIFDVPVRLHPEVTATVKLWVVKA